MYLFYKTILICYNTTFIMSEYLNYRDARRICKGCRYADVLPINPDEDENVVGCYAPVDGKIVERFPLFRVADHYNEISEVDPSKVILFVRFNPRPNTVCNVFLNGMKPDTGKCSKAKAARRVEGKLVKLEIDISSIDHIGRGIQLDY